jgi:ABC-type transporter Mla MlaB component
LSILQAQRMIVRACGRLVLGQGADEPFWSSHLEQATATDVALDLSCVNDGDPATLVRRARQRGTAVSVIAASRSVQRLAELTRLDRALPRAVE